MQRLLSTEADCVIFLNQLQISFLSIRIIPIERDILTETSFPNLGTVQEVFYLA